MADTRASSLCAGCALCCTGWIFADTVLSPKDIASFGGRVSVVDSANGPVMSQPCALHQERCCSVYESRPSGCRTYSCVSLTAVERGELPFDEARERLDRARAAMNELGEALQIAGWMKPGEAGVTAWRNFTRAARHADDPVAFRRSHAGILLAGAKAAAAGELAVGNCL